MMLNNRNRQRRRQEARRQSPPEPSPEYSSSTPINFSNNVSPINIPPNIPSTSTAFRRISTTPSINISPGTRPNSVRISPTVSPPLPVLRLRSPNHSPPPPPPPPPPSPPPSPPPTLILRSPPALTRRPSPLRLRETAVQLFPQSGDGPSPSPPPPFDKIKLKYNGIPSPYRREFRYREIPNNTNPITNELRRILNEFFEMGNNTRELRRLLNEFCESDRSKAALERFKNGYMGLMRQGRPVSAPLPDRNFPNRNYYNLRRSSFNEDIPAPIHNNIPVPENLNEIEIDNHQNIISALSKY
ncbi:serine/arginine repetitive matrix protein 1-like [Rhopilema esculentum]|uniref:serine/arginine repetitive matrix protein 1-like n=1 Tax=Rhopilema esculentum TaxID=499914 RepID=UPI0031D5896C